MTTELRSEQLSWRDELLFLLTNRVPRHALTQAMGWLSRVRSPVLAHTALSIWRLFDDEFRLEEARASRFASIHDIFTRQLRDQARPIDTRQDVVISPCDAIIGAHGRVEAGRAYQAKGYPYRLEELIPDSAMAARYHQGTFVTLRLKSSMYHRFHAPIHAQIRQVFYVSGDCWNVHPPALKKIEKLYCKNERAIVECEGDDPSRDICLVAVAAILVASIHLHCLGGPVRQSGSSCKRYAVSEGAPRGAELGYFEHGSTIVLFAQRGWKLRPDLGDGDRVFMGQALLEPCPDYNQGDGT